MSAAEYGAELLEGIKEETLDEVTDESYLNHIHELIIPNSSSDLFASLYPLVSPELVYQRLTTYSMSSKNPTYLISSNYHTQSGQPRPKRYLCLKRSLRPLLKLLKLEHARERPSCFPT